MRIRRGKEAHQNNVERAADEILKHLIEVTKLMRNDKRGTNKPQKQSSFKNNFKTHSMRRLTLNWEQNLA